MGEGHLSLDRWDFRHLGGIGNGRFGIQDFKHPLCGGDIGDDLVVKIA